MKKLLITGVNGFIGRNAAHYFAKEYEVYGMRKVFGSSKWVTLDLLADLGIINI